MQCIYIANTCDLLSLSRQQICCRDCEAIAALSSSLPPYLWSQDPLSTIGFHSSDVVAPVVAFKCSILEFRDPPARVSCRRALWRRERPCCRWSEEAVLLVLGAVSRHSGSRAAEHWRVATPAMSAFRLPRSRR